ncbi:MAG: YtxH domain-containing protein [Nitrospirales bacterium]|nr:YtxH domain-containing protein [Nitrospira sp.]MDR4499893.1 YtxH domain-containing protein [Nitrospirales bacterium]
MDTDTRYVLFGGLAFITGIILGTGMGILMAPQSGSRTRRKIRHFAEDAGERVNEFTEDARGVVDDLMERGKKFVGNRG